MLEIDHQIATVLAVSGHHGGSRLGIEQRGALRARVFAGRKDLELGRQDCRVSPDIDKGSQRSGDRALNGHI